MSKITQILIAALKKARYPIPVSPPLSEKFLKDEATRISREIGEVLKKEILQSYRRYKPLKKQGVSYCAARDDALLEITKIIERICDEKTKR